MSPDPASSDASRSRRAASVRVYTALVTGLAGAALPAGAAPSADGGSRSFTMQLFDRIDGAAIGLLITACAIVGLLVWRVVVMVRRERPVAVRQKRRAQGADGESTSLERPTLTAGTDWGFDQNKRGALARSPVAMPNSDVDLPSLEHAVTQWTMSDVVKGGSAVPSADALGQAPARTVSPYRTTFNPYFDAEQRDHGVEVVEVADALLQAELLVQLGDPKQAMSLLSRHIRENEKPGPAAWLMLLGLYQSTGREAQYNALGSGFRTLFNAEVPPWASSPDATARDLESYAQVMAKVQATWPGAQARATIDAMLNDDRGGSRQGFSLAAYRELLFLSEILATLDMITDDEAERSGIRRKLDTVG